MTRSIYSFALVFLFGLILTSGLVNSQDEDENLLSFEAPFEVQKNFPYFHSGFDKEGSPVWVCEYGKWDVRNLVEGDRKNADSFDKYTEQMWARFAKSTKEYPDSEGYVLIIDLEGYNSRQATSVAAVQKTLNVARQASAQVRRKGKSCKAVYLVNSNFLFQTVFNLIKPVLGELASIVELYGTNDEKWKNVLRKEIAADQIPEFLGGNKADFKPVKIFGR